jgi:hypothetical protein
MENRFDNNDFEQFVRKNTDQYRMFPSEKVWNGIHKSLHTRRRWYGIGLTLLILTTGVVTWVMLNTSAKNKQVAGTLPEVSIQQPAILKEQKTEKIIVAAKTLSGKTSFITEADKLHKTLFITPDQIADPVTNDQAGTTPVVNTDPVPDTKAEIAHQPETVVKLVTLVKPAVQTKSVSNNPALDKAHEYSFAPVQQASVRKPVVSQPEEISSGIKDIYPLSIESVINAYSYQPKRKRISWQVYFTPTISYRELKENKAFINAARNNTIASNNAVPNSYYTSDINNLVTHKPDVGLQLGFTAGFPLSKKLKLIGGLQFNVSKYDIKAYTYPSEVATIALRNTAGGTNTISTVTNYRNTGGYKANWLHNLYFSASAPIGLEMKLIGNRKTYMGISGTVQPTYMISNRSYLLSTDYKNYAEMPSLIRKWNINTAFEVFAGYSTGKLKWRVGPQVRYQAMSSFQKKYPVQEHLFDFGLKLGVLFNQ